MNVSRKNTCALIDLVEEGVIDSKVVMLAALDYMSEDDVTDMAVLEGFFYEDDVEESHEN